MIYWILKYTLGILIRAIWVKKVNGIKNIPKKGAFIICANHSSYFDFLSLAAVVPRRIYFLTGEVFFEKWQWRWLVTSTSQIRVNRKSKNKLESIKAAEEYLKNDRIICIFPEGTRSSNGEMGKFYNGSVRISKEVNVPILPVGIKGTFNIMSRFDKYPHVNKKCILSFGQLFNANNYSEDVANDVLMQNIKSLCNKIK